jgi:thiazole synthase
MNLTINREPARFEASQPSVRALVEERGMPQKAVVIAVNGEVLRREEWEEKRLKDGDEVEVVRAVAGGSGAGDDPLVIAGERFSSRLFLGTGKYPDHETMTAALERSGTEMVTVAIRYMNPSDDGGSILDRLDLSRYRLLPNTAGATTVEGALKMARLAREATGTEWLKLEIIGDESTLWPDTAATVEATKILVEEGFVVLPYTSPDLVAAMRLEDAGAATVMPLGSPIGTGQGVVDWAGISRIVERVSSVPVVVDAGIGVPSDAAAAMELGADAVLVNTAVARADDPPLMAEAMKLGVEAGRSSYLAGRMPVSPVARPSSPKEGVPA